MIGPVSTIVMGAIWLGEPLTRWMATGTACVIIGIWLPTMQGARARRPAEKATV